jgi:hypothetical protein
MSTVRLERLKWVTRGWTIRTSRSPKSAFLGA